MNAQEIVKTEKAKISESGFAAFVVAFFAAAIKIVVSVIRAFGIFDDGSTAETIAQDVGYLFSSVVVTAVLIVLGIMFKRISKCGSPFIKESVKSIRLIAVLLFANSVAGPLAETVTADIINSNLKHLFVINESYLFFGLIFLFIGQLFSYGCALQKEYDETI